MYPAVREGGDSEGVGGSLKAKCGCCGRKREERDAGEATCVCLLHQHHYYRDKGQTGGSADIDKESFVQNPSSACF